MRRLFILSVLLLTLISSVQAQRTTDKLDRGLVAVPSGNGSFVSWRIFGEEYYDTEYNLYRDGQKVNDAPLKVSNFTDPNGKAGCKYQVAAVVRGKEQEKCAAVTRLNQQYIQFAVASVTDREGKDMTADCNINDIALADLTGDGVSEFIMKRNYGGDYNETEGNYPISNKTRYNHIEVYNIKGERLWWIDLGPNMVSGPDEQYDAVGYDWDQDGKAEVLMRGADNMIIHCSDGTTVNIGNMNVNTRNTVRHDDNNAAYTNTGAEYLLYLEGATGKPYQIGSASSPNWMTYPVARGDVNDWGDGYGHRATKHYFGAPFLDGRKPYIFLGRGCYTKHHMKAFSVDPVTHKLSLYWEWSNNGGWGDPWFGNGYHNFGIADVDWDGRDEICFGSMVIDDNGKGLSTTGLGHGDAQHCSDFDPYRHGQEIFACNEDEPAMNYRNATTSKIYYRMVSTGDDGRALCGNFSNNYPGAIGHSSQSGTISCVADKPIDGGPGGFTNNFRIYWDGDLLEEGLDGANSREGAARVFKGDGSIVFTADGTANCNWTKNTPSSTGDILGDWREEIVVRTADNKFVRVYTTNLATKYRNYTLWHDHQYRQGMVWETMGYNQPPHASYFLGELEGITVAPPPFTMTGRKEINNGGSIDASYNDQHVLMCEYADTKISVAEGANPYMVTFNIPSWVQGTNSNITNGGAKINYKYYTCEVSGAAFSGNMRLVKQGDGILTLPATDNTYTGETNIWAGTLNFDGTLKNSPLWLNRFAELNTNGTFRSIKMDYDAKLRPGHESAIGTVTTDSLLLGFGSRIIFDLDDSGEDLKADKVKAKIMTIEKKNWQYGPQFMVPVFQFIGRNSDGQMTTGRYLIGEIEKIEGELKDIRLEGMSTIQKATLVWEEGKLYLNIENMRSATTITWNGSESGVWDLDQTQNFTKNEESVGFVTGDDVLFNDEASIFNITLDTQLEADTVFFENSRAYTLKGNGELKGKTTLVKNGKGSLTIQTDNTYTGGNRISGGTVIVKSLANANQPKGNLGAMTTNANKFIIENGGELRATATVTNGSPIRFETEQGGVINNTNDFFVSAAMSGTQMTKRGAGWMKLSQSNPSLERMVLTAGTVQCLNANVPAKTVIYQGGELRENTGTSYAVNVTKSKKGTWYLANSSTYTNKVTGEGTLTIFCTTIKGSSWYATRTPIAMDFSEFEGTIVPRSSQDDPVLERFTMSKDGSMPKGTMDIGEKVEVQNNGRTFHIGKVTGSGSLGGSCAFDNNSTPGVNTWKVGNDADWTTTVRITSNANFQKVGTGRITWNGANTNSGTTTITEGELKIGSSAKLGTGKLTIQSGAVLSGTNKSTNPLGNSSVTVQGEVRPGSYNGAVSGSIFFNNKSVTFNSNSLLVIGASKNASATANGCTSIEGINTLTMNGTIRIVPSSSNTLAVGDSIRVFVAKKLSGTPKFDMQGGIDWDTSRISEGLLIVKSVELGVSELRRDNNADPKAIYDLRGRKVRTANETAEGLPGGIYIRNGKKFIVK